MFAIETYIDCGPESIEPRTGKEMVKGGGFLANNYFICELLDIF
jgi:hypothetical protein